MSEKYTNTNSYKFKCKLQKFLRNDTLTGISTILFVSICAYSVILTLAVGMMYAHSEDRLDRNIFNIGKDNYQESYILYNAEKYRETTVMSEDGEQELDLMYVVKHSEETDLDSNFFWTTKASKIVFCTALILFCFQILALSLNSCKDDDGDKQIVTYDNDGYYCVGISVIISIALMLLVFIYNSGVKFKSQVDEVYTAAAQAIDVPMTRDTVYMNKLTTRQKFQMVNKYLKKMVYNKTPMMFDIKNKQYIPFDLKTVKNFSEVEMMFNEKK